MHIVHSASKHLRSIKLDWWTYPAACKRSKTTDLGRRLMVDAHKMVNTKAVGTIGKNAQQIVVKIMQMRLN